MDSLVVEYKDKTLSVPLFDWDTVPSHGVQSITITVNDLSHTRDAASIYWLYKENDYWVVGSGSVRYDYNLISETLIYKDGKQVERKRDFMPDLTIDKIKLGWWKFG